MKKLTNIYFFTFLVFLFCLDNSAKAQFYNGHQMTFGKNRVQYKKRFYQFYRYDDFDVYFYAGEEKMSKRISEIAKEEIKKAENFFGYGLQKRLIFIVYKKLSDFRESNIGFDTQNENSNIGGSTKIIDNKVLVFYENVQKNLRQEIRAGIYKLLINEIIYSGNFRQRLTNSALINLPDWYIEGLVSYLSEEWTPEIEDQIRDGFESGRYKNINHLIGNEARIAGYSFWYFISDIYGKNIIPNILYVTRLNKSTEAGFRSLLGISVKGLTPEWKEYYKERFKLEKLETEQHQGAKLLKSKKHRKWRELKTDPHKRYISYIKHKKGRYAICIYDTKKKKRKIIRRKGHPLEQITDYSQPVTAWHPGGQIFSFITEEYGWLYIYDYNLDRKKLTRKRLSYFDKVLSFAYSDDGYSLVLSGVKNGQSDIYVYVLPANSHIRITNDLADDLNPVFTEKSQKIVFSSNRKDTSLNSTSEDNAHTYDLFEYNYKQRAETLTRITNTPYINEHFPQYLSKNKYLLLSDKNGIQNIYTASFDSTISNVDTSIHYRYFSVQNPITDYPHNIKEYAFSPRDNKIYDLILKDNRYKLFENTLNTNRVATTNFSSPFMENIRSEQQYTDSLKLAELRKAALDKARKDSLRANPPKNIAHPDSLLIDIDAYVFEIEKNNIYYDIHPIKDSIFQTPTENEQIIDTRNYKLNFYTNHLVQQIDFGLLNNSYQIFTGGAYYFNPGINVFTKVGAYDLLEDYRITGGFRIGGNFDSYEYLLSLEDLKGRLDKQYIYHRQTQVHSYYDDYGWPHYFKIFSNEGIYSLKYPFNQVAAVRGTFNFRHDKGLWQSNDYNSLRAPIQNQAFIGVKLEYIFDNTRTLGINLWDGTRFKLFGEFYQQVGEEMFGEAGMGAFSGYTNFATLGYDFRFYKKIHRTLIFASRIGAGTSFGKSKLLYYLGGVDNWFSLSPDKEMFNSTVNINYDQEYVYQAVATNMRGFIQNARNGNTFFVINNEIRFPIIRYLVNRPLNSDFLNTFQIVAFLDAGAAWSGKSPYDEKNKYLTETIKSGPITVIVDKNRWPVIFGYGFGLRSRILGYFMRLDWAWGIDNYYIHDRVFYFSLNLDF